MADSLPVFALCRMLAAALLALDVGNYPIIQGS
jgi:hypothetical protein